MNCTNTSFEKRPPLFVLVLLPAAATLALNMFLPALHEMAEHFHTSYEIMSISISVYFLFAAFIQLIIAPLSDQFGRRKITLWVLAVFIFSSFGAAFAPNLELFLVARMLQSTISVGLGLAIAVINDTTPKEQVTSRVAFLTMLMAIIPLIGPFIGGVMSATLGWSSIFIFYGMLGVFIFILCYMKLGETHFGHATTFQAYFSSIGLVIKAKEFWNYSTTLVFSVATFYAFIIGAPFAGTQWYGTGPAQTGLFVGSISIGFMIGNFLSFRYSSYFGISTMMIAGRIVALVSLSAALAWLSWSSLSIWDVTSVVICVGIGNGLTIPSSNTGAMNAVPALAGTAAGFASALVIFGGSAILQITSWAVTRENGEFLWILMMFITVCISLLATLFVWHAAQSR